MISKNFSTFEVDGIQMQFDTTKFKTYFKVYCKPKDQPKIKIGEAEERLAEFVNIGKDAVHQWRFGKNGPSTIDIIKDIAKFLNLSSYKSLLSERKESSNMNYSTEQQKAFKRIYDAIIDFMDEFDHTDGFNDLWDDFKNKGIKNPECAIQDYALKLIDKIWLVHTKEYFYLHDTEPYNELEDYIGEVLYDIFDGKCSYAYRFESPGGKTEDYTNALSKLNRIIEPIV